jgi:dinuclear metal center YbgI/SA1388 family protein
LRFQESYDNSGLLLGQPDAEVTGAILSLDCTEDVVQEAVEYGYNLVISHHPIIFSGIKRFDQGNYIERAIIQAIKHDVQLYAIHTNLDNVLRNGVNTKIGEKLGLQNQRPLKAHPGAHLEADYQLGSGVVGELPGQMRTEDFLDRLKETMRAGVVRHTDGANDTVRRIAVCGGSGSHLLHDAIKAEADVFVTADFKYHQFFDANDKIMIADIGHYESEYFTIELLFELISNKFPKFAARCTQVNTNPVRYF